MSLDVLEQEEQPRDAVDVEWLRQPFRTAYHAIEDLESSLGEFEDPFFSYRGRRTLDELEADAFGNRRPD